MPTQFLLDTNILSDLLKNPQGKVAAKIASLPTLERDSLTTSIIVAAELRYGAAKSGSPILAARVDQLLHAIQILPLEPGADRQYGQIRTQLEKSGTSIGANDLLIAAHALAINAVLVTGNTRGFNRVKALKVENWLRS